MLRANLRIKYWLNWLIIVGVLSAVSIFYLIFYANNIYHNTLPIMLGNYFCPVTMVQIEKETYCLAIDSGSKFAMNLKKSQMAKIEQKTINGEAEWKDYKGNSYVSSTYVVPKINMGGLFFTHVSIQVEDDKYEVNTSLGKSSPSSTEAIFFEEGSIGRPLLEQHNWLIDFHARKAWISNDIKKLKEMGYDLSVMVRLPFKKGSLGPTIELDTSLKKMRLLIDTGATVNCIRDSFLDNPELKKGAHGLGYVDADCGAKGKDLGRFSFHPVQLTPIFDDIDGILGAPFLEQYAVYFDFENQFIYLKKSE